MIITRRPALRLAAVVAAAAIFLSGCISTRPIDPKTGDNTTPGGGGSHAGLPKGHPWGNLSSRLAKEGFSSKQISALFNSPGLTYSSAPMETKLRELYGIFYKSERTKLAQEKLYQLGYDVYIDGRFGGGTRNAVKAFQRDQGLSQTGQITDSLVTQMDKAMKGKSLRSLSSYTPPPATKPSRTTTYKQFTNSDALAQVTANYKSDKAIFDRMEKKFGVPGPVVAGIMMVETGYGNYFGKNSAVQMLASMAASKDFSLIKPAVNDLCQSDAEAAAWLAETADKRGDWAYQELVALLHYVYQSGAAPQSVPGSIYGAVGYGQFMPSNIAKYGADGNGDGRIDLFNKEDAIFSTGRFLKEHGWQGNMKGEESRRAVVMKYNKSAPYVNTVLYLADWISTH